MVELQINIVTMLDIGRNSSLVNERLPSNIRISGTLKAVSVKVYLIPCPGLRAFHLIFRAVIRHRGGNGMGD